MSLDPRYDNWPVQGEDSSAVEWVGLKGAGGHLFVNQSTSEMFDAEPDEDTEVFKKIKGSEHEPEEDKSPGEPLEEIGEEHDFEMFSDFAREHLKKNDET